MFLTQSEIATLTGYATAGWQRRWLDRHQWKYEIAANGRVVVSRAYAESRMSGIQMKREPVMHLESLRGRA
jgi:hypothetical protein